MEVDSGNQKGGYTIAPVTQEIVLDPTKILDWNEYKRNDGQPTFGLLCQISPDGRYVAGTVKDRALALYQADLMFSQLFFLVKGITAIYDRETKTISALPGADDPEYVQTNATWSPDGKYIVFARSRSKAFETETMRKTKSLIVPQQEGEAFLKGGKTFLFDLYRIPFNDGKGGKAEPIPGASNNGMSNYFAKYSPDGKWIVFCKARSFMLLQPDSQLYIIPAAGGQARRLRCNTARMNSWHSWSPNGRWLVFSSKVNGPYTQLFLTHIDAEGNSTPPVVLDRFTAPERAANIPEFVNQPANAIRTIREAFMDDHSHWRVGREFEFGEDWKSAERMYRMALKINPRSRESHESLGLLLFHRLDQQEEGLEHLRTVLQLAPEDVVAHYNVGSALANMGRVQEAVGYFEQALKLKPDYADVRRNLDEARADAAKAQATIRQCEAAVEQNPDSAEVLSQLANALMNAGRGSEAIGPFERAVALNPKDAGAHNSLAWLLATKVRGGEGNPAKAVSLAKRACELTGNNSAGCLDTLAVAHAAAGQFPEAIAAAEKAIQLATAAGQVPLASRIEGRLESYRAGRAVR